MAYSGIYKVKNKKKYRGNSENVVFRSLWENACFKWCDENPQVKSWSSEEVVVPYFYEADKKYHRYFVDLLIQLETQTILVEIKPKKETAPPKSPARKTKKFLEESLTFVKNQNKWNAASEFAKDRGWDFQVWTEETLQNLGILPKTIKPLKPLKPLKPFKSSKKAHK